MRAGLSRAANHLAMGVWYIGDVVRKPMQGAKTDGVEGLFRGLGHGLLGSVVKPVVELGSGMHAVTQGVRHRFEGAVIRVKERRVSTRRRPPRVMYSAASVREYDETAALLTLEVARAQPLPSCSTKDCKAIEHARFGITDHIVVSRTGANPDLSYLMLLLTPKMLMLVVLGRSGIGVPWSIAVPAFRGARASSHGVVIRANQTQLTDSSQNIVNVPTNQSAEVQYKIPCGDAKIIREVCKMLGPLQRNPWL